MHTQFSIILILTLLCFGSDSACNMAEGIAEGEIFVIGNKFLFSIPSISHSAEGKICLSLPFDFLCQSLLSRFPVFSFLFFSFCLHWYISQSLKDEYILPSINYF